MTENLELTIRRICAGVGNDRARMMDVVRAVQGELSHVPGRAMDLIATCLGTHRVEVESVVTFYAFLSERPRGKVAIRLCGGCIDKMQGGDRVAQAFAEELGIRPGETTPDGRISLETTGCLGMCDQAPAALIGDVLVPWLSRDKVQDIVRVLRQEPDPHRLVTKLGDGNNAHRLVRSMVVNNIRKTGPVIFSFMAPGAGLQPALAMSPAEVIRALKTARLRGRGGAGFPTGMKWEFTRSAPDPRRFVVANADEGEPGTFKDRVLLTEAPDLVFEGMTIAGYAIGAEAGILYLRGEYAYLLPYLEHILEERRRTGLLGRDICGKKGIHFDIRIQLGAGAYICGEETALLSSCEGLRGDPKNRPPFPAQKGYLGHPTAVNNVETFCCVARILEKGPGWFAEMGSKGSAGTKLFSVSGDCTTPGVYELPFGITLGDLLKEVGGEDAKAVQVGGPSGQLVGPAEFGRQLCYDHLATGGSVMIFGPDRDLLGVVENFLEFFVEESCGYCTPCRAGNLLLLERIRQIRAGRGEPADLDYLQNLGEAVKATARCGLGQTSPNPVLFSLKNFRAEYERLVKARPDGMRPAFDLTAAVAEAEGIVGRKSVHLEG